MRCWEGHHGSGWHTLCPSLDARLQALKEIGVLFLVTLFLFLSFLTDLTCWFDSFAFPSSPLPASVFTKAPCCLASLPFLTLKAVLILMVSQISASRQEPSYLTTAACLKALFARPCVLVTCLLLWFTSEIMALGFCPWSLDPVLWPRGHRRPGGNLWRRSVYLRVTRQQRGGVG